MRFFYHGKECEGPEVSWREKTNPCGVGVTLGHIPEGRKSRKEVYKYRQGEAYRVEDEEERHLLARS